MGKLDVATRKFMRDPKRFADVFNFYLYGGKPVINPDSLHEMDIVEDILIKRGSTKQSVQRFRDLMKKMVIMTDGHTELVFFALENESSVNHAMVIKDMLYDAVDYARQVQEIAKRHREAGDDGQDHGEFLSGFHKEDKLVLVITLVLYYGAQPWDGPRSLKEMLNTDDPVLLQYAQDYKLNLIAPAELSDEDLDKFDTDFGAVLKYIKHSNDTKALDEIVHQDACFRQMAPETFDVINEATNSRLKPVKKEGTVDMCAAIEGMIALNAKKVKREASEQTALKMLTHHEPLVKIRQYTGISVTAVRRIAREHHLQIVES